MPITPKRGSLFHAETQAPYICQIAPRTSPIETDSLCALSASWRRREKCLNPPHRHLQFSAVIQENVGFNFKPASNARNVVDRDIAFGPLDPAEIGAVDAALVGQRFLTETTSRSKATHIPRQNVPQRSFVSLFHKGDFGSLALLRRPLLSYIRCQYLQIADAPALFLERFEKFAETAQRRTEQSVGDTVLPWL